MTDNPTTSTPAAEPKTRPVCAACGSINVRMDAVSEYSVELQEWVLCAGLDGTDCEDCESECSLDWVPVVNPDDPICACQNCTWKGLESHLLEIKHFHERVAPGEPCPNGVCPICGAVAHQEAGQ